VVGVFVVGYISLSKSVDPFVIEVEEKSGITNVVNPLDTKTMTSDEALKKYFIMKYLRARETYDVTDYEYNYSTIVRLFSTGSVYSKFKAFINDSPNSPVKLYGTSGVTTLKVRSTQFFDDGRVQIRFTIIENGQGAQHNKIATLKFAFVPMQMNDEDRYINPLGFQITEYRVDEETL
jgi:type IV secretion system protein VirB8